MRLIPVSLILFLCMASCGSHDNKHSTRSIIGDEKPSWKIIDDADAKIQELNKNVFKLTTDGEIIGTGFYYNGSIVTNAHVALRWKMQCQYFTCDDLVVENDYFEGVVSEVVTISKPLDHSKLRVDWKKIQPSSLFRYPVDENLPETGDEVYLIGYNHEIRKFVVSQGIVKNAKYNLIFKPFFAYDADTLPGMSGSPVINSNYEIIGIHFGIPNGAGFNRAIPVGLIGFKSFAI